MAASWPNPEDAEASRNSMARVGVMGRLGFGVDSIRPTRWGIHAQSTVFTRLAPVTMIRLEGDANSVLRECSKILGHSPGELRGSGLQIRADRAGLCAAADEPVARGSRF